MARALGGDCQSVKLARQAYSKIADVDHFLNFAKAFLQNFTGLDADQEPEIGFGRAQGFSIDADEIAARRRRRGAPSRVGGMGRRDHAVEIGLAVLFKSRDLGAVDRRADGEIAARNPRRGDAEFLQQRRDIGGGGFGKRGHGKFSYLSSNTSTPLSTMSSWPLRSTQRATRSSSLRTVPSVIESVRRMGLVAIRRAWRPPLLWL